MKELILDNFATCFPNVDTVDPQTGRASEYFFVPYVTLQEVEGNQYRHVFWKCTTCGEHATQTTRESAIPEVVLSCSCRDNYSYGLDFAVDLTNAAAAIPLESFNS